MAAAAAAAAAVFLLPNSFPKPSTSTVKYQIPHSTLSLSINPLRTHKRLPFRTCSAVQVTAVVEEKITADADVDPDVEKKRKLYVANLPWSHTAEEIEQLFGECGTVKKVEIVKQNNGLSRGFAFVTMGSGEEAQAVIDKFHSYELLGRSLKVEFAKSFRKPSPATPRVVEVETRHKIYVSNLAWKVRTTNLREFFSSKFKPVSARVIFDDRRSAGYGFVSFATEEEAVAVFTELDGQSLMGRPLRLKIGPKKEEEAVSGPKEEEEAAVSEPVADSTSIGPKKEEPVSGPKEEEEAAVSEPVADSTKELTENI